MKQDAGRLVVGAAAARVGVTVRGALLLAVCGGGGAMQKKIYY